VGRGAEPHARVAVFGRRERSCAKQRSVHSERSERIARPSARAAGENRVVDLCALNILRNTTGKQAESGRVRSKTDRPRRQRWRDTAASAWVCNHLDFRALGVRLILLGVRGIRSSGGSRSYVQPARTLTRAAEAGPDSSRRRPE
jgi:hypothetical protein